MSSYTAKMDSVFYDETEAYEDEQCEIRIDDTEIVISYEDEDGFVIYKGKNEGNGHYVLTCPDRNAKATLHQLPGSKFLEGYWTEDGERGFWRIKLPK